jgi:hypothetical protein
MDRVQWQNRERSVSIAMGYILDCQSSTSWSDKGFIFTPLCPEGFWDTPNLLSNSNFQPGANQLTSHLHLVYRSKMVELNFFIWGRVAALSKTSNEFLV